MELNQMKWNRFWMMFLLLVFSVVGGQKLQAGDFQKPFAVDYDIYNFNITMDSFVFKPHNTNTKLQVDFSYPESKGLKNLPVIYITDGQWRRMDHKYVHYLSYKKIIPPVVVAGIGYPDDYDAGQVRMIDMMSQPENFFKAIKEEIIPRVEGKYGVDGGQRYLFGASAGGYFTVHTFLKNALEADSTFHGFIGASPYLPAGSSIIEMAQKLVSKEREFKSNLYLSYGEKESITYYHTPNNELYKILENKNLKNLRFHHFVYPGADHFDTTRLTLIDGLRLFLGSQESRGIGAVDLKYGSYHYDFKTSTQYYDWKTNVFVGNSFTTDPQYSLDQGSGSFKLAADFTKYNSLRFETASVFFEGLAGRELEFSVFIPKDLAKLKYNLRLFVYSTHSYSLDWIMDYSESFKLNKNGWNTFKYKWRGKVKQGNESCIRGFGVMITRNDSAPPWKGDLYFDEVKW